MKKRLLALLLAAMLLMTALLPALGGASALEGEGETRYTKSKVISVLFDNSPSMKKANSQTVYRWEYARYALQTLLSTLTSQDTLIITPMNTPEGNAVTDTDYGVVVDLSKQDREAELDRVLNETFLATEPTAGGTPHESIPTAIKQLTDRGMKTTASLAADETSESEYFLVVLTDGAFSSCLGLPDEQQKIDLAASYFAQDIEKYAFFQSIYIGFDTDALDLRGAPALAGKTNFKAYKAPNTASIGGVMRDVSDRITGRYSLDVTCTPDTATLRIPLDDVHFALRSVTVMATNTHARFSQATYGGKTVTLAQKAQFEGFTATEDIHMEGGFTATLTLADEASFFEGEIVVSLTEALGADAVVSVQLEPALALVPVVRTTPDGEEIDSAYVNSHLSQGDSVYVSYRLIEKGSNRVIDPSDVGGASVSISYDGASYATGAAIPLVAGKKEIGISVSMMNGQYTLYTSFPCVVLANPSYFRIEAGEVTAKSETLYEATFTVYENNAPIGSSLALERLSPTATAKASNGQSVPVSLRKNANGTFTVSLDAAGLEYDTYTVLATVRSEDGNVRSAELPIGYYPTGLVLTSVGAGKIEKTLHGLRDNGEAFAFALTAQDKEIPFRNALLSYTLTVGGKDVTAAATLDGNRLSFVPTAETLGDLALTAGEHDVCLTVTLRGVDTETVTAEAHLTLTKTVFEILPLAAEGTVDRFALSDNQSALYFRVLRDGAAMTAEELTAALSSGELSVEESYRTLFSPVRTLATVEEWEGAPAVRVTFTAGHFAPVRGLFTSMLTFGDGLTVGLAYQDAYGEGSMALAPVNALSYVWRVVVILYLVQLIIVALTLFVFPDAVHRVPRGALIAVTFADGIDPKKPINIKNVTRMEVKRTVTLLDTLQPLRLIPFYGLFVWKKEIDIVSLNKLVCEPKKSGGTQLALTFTPQLYAGTLDATAPSLMAWKKKAKNGMNPSPLNAPTPELMGAKVKYEAKAIAATLHIALSTSSGVVQGNRLYLFWKRS